jgi:hypothetical protein
MRHGRTRAALLARLERLEHRAIPRPSQCFKLRLGDLRRLPESYVGARHVVIVKHLAPQGDQEWVEYEEVPGPNPNPPLPGRLGASGYIDIAFVTPYPSED